MRFFSSKYFKAPIFSSASFLNLLNSSISESLVLSDPTLNLGEIADLDTSIFDYPK